jgi:hypothetical protein
MVGGENLVSGGIYRGFSCLLGMKIHAVSVGAGLSISDPMNSERFIALAGDEPAALVWHVVSGVRNDLVD